MGHSEGAIGMEFSKNREQRAITTQRSNRFEPVPGRLKRRRRTPGVRRVLTAETRLLPHFIIIGAQRCGTTSLYRNLVKHPCVAPALLKEVHYFDWNYHRGTNWYRSHFPSSLYQWYARKIWKRDTFSGEASPYYFFHPRVPERVGKLLPEVKLVVLLRNPMHRAYSHYQMEFKKGYETLSFDEAISAESERLAYEAEHAGEEDTWKSFHHRHHSYLSRGNYVDQLTRWMKYTDEQRLLILRTEDFWVDPTSTYQRVVQFLDLPRWELQDYRSSHISQYAKMDRAIRRRLTQYFRPQNQRLYDLLGRDFGWDQ